MRFSAVQLAAALALVTAGCGGIAEGRYHDPDAGGQGPVSADNGGKSNGITPIEGETQLGECQLGPPESRDGGDCAWVADRRCYASREMACNCACPRSRDSLCLSGFEAGPQGHVEVNCD